jgi:RNA polymerase sigma-70 factor, ECF subfamily
LQTIGATQRTATVPTFREVFEAHAPYVWRALRGLGVAERDVDDLCQEVFVVVHRRLPEFEPRANLRTWLYAICLRAASDYRRRAFVRREQVTDAPPDLSAPADQHDRAERTWARDALDRALERLDDDKRDAFVLYEIEGLSLAEVAEVVGAPLKTVHSRLAAARREVVELIRRWQAVGGAT